MGFNLKTDYKAGDKFKSNEANNTNKAILALEREQEKVGDIAGVVGNDKLDTKSQTITGAINEIKVLATENKVLDIEDTDIESLFKK